MLDLKDIEKTNGGIRAVYTISHSDVASGTLLEQELHLVIDPRTGAVSGRLDVDGLTGATMDEAVDRLAAWCERLARGLREPRKVVASVPVYERDWRAGTPASGKGTEGGDRE